MNLVVTVFDISPNILIERITEALKENENITPPTWAAYVKTGSNREVAPTQEDWWYRRAASLLRRIYTQGPVGIERLRTRYGGRKNRGVRPNKTVKGSGHILRTALQQLESAQYVKILKGEGRVITNIGQQFLDKLATEVNQKMETEKTA